MPDSEKPNATQSHVHPSKRRHTLEGTQVAKEETDALQLQHVATRGVAKSPIERLPSEILSEIFKHLRQVAYIPLTKKDSPWVLARVCSRWRLISRTDPQLWECFIVKLDVNWRYFERTLDLFPSTALLHVSLESDDGITPGLKLLPPYLRRCKSLNLNKSFKSLDELWSGVQNDSFANLHQLSIDISHESDSINIQTPESKALWEFAGQALQMASRLEAVFLTSYEESESKILASLSLPWGQIKHLIIDLEGLDFVDICDILNECQSLATLCLYGSEEENITYLTDDDDALHLPCLHNLTLRHRGSVAFFSAHFNWETLIDLHLMGLKVPCHDFHHALKNCTNLKKLFLEAVRFNKRFPQQPLCIPHLQSLYIEYSIDLGYPQKHPRLKLSNFVCPKLSYVKISYTHNGDDNDNLPDPMGLPQGPIATLHYSADIPTSWIHGILTHISATAKSVSFPESHLEYTILCDIGSGSLLPFLQDLECKILDSEAVDAVIEMLDIYVSRTVQPPGSSGELKHLSLLGGRVSKAQNERLRHFRTEHGIKITRAPRSPTHWYP